MKNCVVSQRLLSVRPGLLRANDDYGPGVDPTDQSPAGCRAIGSRRLAGRRMAGRRLGKGLPAAVVLAAVAGIAASPRWANGANLVVDESETSDAFGYVSTSPLTINSSGTYDQIVIGTASQGVINQTAGSLTSNEMYIGAYSGSYKGTGF